MDGFGDMQQMESDHSPNFGTSTSGAFTPIPNGVTLAARCDGSTETMYVRLCDEISAARSCALLLRRCLRTK